MRYLFLILLFLISFSFADKINFFIDYDGVWAPAVGIDNQRLQLCAASTATNIHKRKQISDFCKLEFGAKSNNFSFNHQNNSQIYLYSDKKSKKIIATLSPDGLQDCNYSIYLKDNGELTINNSSGLCKYKINAKIEKDHSYLKLYSLASAVSIN